MNNQWHMIKQLDEQLHEWQVLSQKYGRPKDGWIKTLRKALGMTAQQLAERLGLARSRIVQLEDAEKHDATTLHTLRRVAEAMNCELVYAIVPKISTQGKTLEDIIKTNALEVAETTITNVAHSMSLENQSVEKNQQAKQKKELVKKLLQGSLKKNIWRNK
jgi:predicted DNA-binding mobile mystery protein A